MTVFEFFTILCVPAGAITGGIVGSSYGFVAAVAGVLAGAALGLLAGPLLGVMVIGAAHLGARIWRRSGTPRSDKDNGEQ